MTDYTRGVHLGYRSAIVLSLVSVVGVVAFTWPLLAGAQSTAVAHSKDAPWLFAMLLPLVLAVVLAQVADGGIDAKGVAMLGVLAAVGTALRPLGTGIAGFEPVFILLALGGRAMGRGFGFALGTITLFSSAVLTGGVGPWLPFQMIAAGWFGFGAGCLPARLRGRAEIFALAAYGAIAALVYGLLLNLSFWPWAVGLGSQISYVPGAPLPENLQRWIAFDITTSLGFDIPRAVITAVAILLLGRPVLFALRRATRRAAFGAIPDFSPAGLPSDSKPLHPIADAEEAR
ncbi:MAG: ECF transporter S component [Candidatus Nanopelagicales bacterium]|nr:ECF transporter S component [Candidatus Nanopelagicales bacterium]